MKDVVLDEKGGVSDIKKIGIIIYFILCSSVIQCGAQVIQCSQRLG